MKKLKISVGVLAFVGLAVLNFTQSESVFVSKALASSSSGSSSSSSSVNHSGGLANKRCPIWNIQYVTETGLIPKITIICETGGVYKCEEGTCPHGV